LGKVLPAYLIAFIPTLALVAGLVLTIETIVHHTVNPGDDPNIKAFGMNFNASSPITWILALFLVVGGFFVARETWRRLARAWDDALTAAHERGYHA
jgi:branched-chain amino acid transport system permease protein